MDLLGNILRDVSRSFYVSIRLLPRKLRQPIGLAYLLARATDTLADTAGIPAATRAQSLQTLASTIQGQSDLSGVNDLINSFGPLQTNEAEKVLIQSLPQCLVELNKASPADRADIREVLAKINRGQTLDVERPILATATELEEYIYLVAGCVGEFWTRLCFRHVKNFSDRSEPEMSEMGKRYGMGLQLINILRDAGNDLQNGRCYFPEEELKTVGLSASTVNENTEPFMLVFRKWLDRAQRGLDAGMQYVDGIRNRRIRAATVLPALIGARTTALLRSTGADTLRDKIKVPRREVQRIIGMVAVTLASRPRLHRLFRHLLS